MEVQAVKISVVVPVKNEEESVHTLAAEITAALVATPHAWECVWVNDGSTDGTLAVLRQLRAVDPRHRWISLDRNYGQSGALAAGFAHAKGEFFAMLDGDGQNDPADIPRLFELLQRDGVDFVIGVRAKRRDSWVRRLSSRVANGYRDALLHDHVSDSGCAMRVFRRACVQGMPVFKGMHRFMAAMVVLKGLRIAETPVNHRPRERGQTKYGVGNRLWVGIYDTFAVRWMRNRMVWPQVATTDQDPPTRT